MSNFNILNYCEDLVDYVFIITEQTPKKLRLDVVPKLRECSFEIMENIIIANNFDIGSKQRRKSQHWALTKIKVLEALSEICLKRNYITKHQFETLTLKTFALCNMITKWSTNESNV